MANQLKESLIASQNSLLASASSILNKNSGTGIPSNLFSPLKLDLKQALEALAQQVSYNR